MNNIKVADLIYTPTKNESSQQKPPTDNINFSVFKLILMRGYLIKRVFQLIFNRMRCAVICKSYLYASLFFYVSSFGNIIAFYVNLTFVAHCNYLIPLQSGGFIIEQQLIARPLSVRLKSEIHERITWIRDTMWL